MLEELAAVGKDGAQRIETVGKVVDGAPDMPPILRLIGAEDGDKEFGGVPERPAGVARPARASACVCEPVAIQPGATALTVMP